MSDPTRYGDFYWCVKTPLSPNGEIYAYADRVEVREGCLIMWRDRKDGETLAVPEVNMVFAPGSWTVIFAASVMDGHAVTVEHWQGEVERR